MPLRRSLLLALAIAALAVPAAASASTPIPGQYVVVLKDGANLEGMLADDVGGAGTDVLQVYGHALNGYTARLSPLALSLVKADPRVDYVVQDREGDPLSAAKAKPPPPPPPGPVPQTLPTGMDRIDADLSSQLSGDGSGAVSTPAVAIVDSGIDLTQPDLNVVGGVDCLVSTDQYNDGTYNDTYGHGTHLAGTVAGKDDTVNVVGVVPGAPLYAVREINSLGSGTFSGQLCGVDWVTAHAAETGIKVANFSQASLVPTSDDGNCGNTNNDAMHQAICRSTAAGVLWVAASGNSSLDISTNSAQSPMGYDEVLTVNAVSDGNGKPGGGGTISCRSGEVDDKYASFSDWVSSPADQAHTIAEPGVCINSDWPGGGTSVQSGTSMSAPTAAGVAALCIGSGACPGTPAQTIQKLVGDATAYNQANPSFGFTGDPLHAPVSGRYYGYILPASLY